MAWHEINGHGVILVRLIGLRAAAATAAIIVPTMVSAQDARIEEIRERLTNANQWRDHVMVVAHRGGGLQAGKMLFPENSIAAVVDAIALGAEMVELDVQKSKDGVYVVLHDTWLDRTTTCKGQLIEKTLAELKACRLVVEGTGQATAETVPTLGEMFAVTRDRIYVNIDNKLSISELPGMAAVARRSGVADQVVIKQNLWNAAKVTEAENVLHTVGDGVMFMPIIADDAVTDPAFLETVTAAFSSNAVELITWHAAGEPMTSNGGPLFGARARAVAARGDWHLWVNTYAIVNKAAGMLSGGRGDQLATYAGLPGEAFGFWVDRGATIIQTDEPRAAIEWLAANGYRRPYGDAVSGQVATQALASQ